MQCRNCSGNEFSQTGGGNFKCSYCGTLFYEEKKVPGRSLNLSRKAAISAGAGALFIAVIVLVIVTKQYGSKGGEQITDATGSGDIFNNVQSLDAPSAEVTGVDLIPDTIGNLYFLVMCRNNGKAAIRLPYVTVRLFSAKNEKVATGTGYALSDNLNPGDETPVYILVKNCPEYARYEIDYKPELPYIVPEGGVFRKRFTAEITGAVVKSGPYEGTYTASGKIINRSNYTGSYVQVAVLLYDKQNKAIGYGSNYISEKKLKSGDYDFFDIVFYGIDSAPDHYRIFYHGGAD